MVDYQLRIKELAVYPECNTGSKAAIAYCALGLAGEVGETCNKFKKVLRGDKSLEEAKEGLVKELGGVFWYLNQLCTELGLSPSEIMEANYNELKSRLARNVIMGDGDNR